MSPQTSSWKFQDNTKFFGILEKMRSESELCDVILVAGNCEIHAHRIILSAFSIFFRTMFTNFAESKQKRIILREIDGTILQVLIDYMYKGEITVNDCDVKDVLQAANHLQLIDLSDVCNDFLANNTNPINCIGASAYAKQRDSKDLEVATNACSENRFSGVVKSKELFSNDISPVMRNIRLEPRSTDEEESLNSERKKSTVDLSELRRFLAYQNSSGTLPTINPYIGNHAGLTDNLQLLIVAGRDKSGPYKLEYLDLRKQQWIPLVDMPETRLRFGLTAIEETVYLLGGAVNGGYSQSMKKYEFSTNTWSECTDMNSKRERFIAVPFDNHHIYAVGGKDGLKDLNTAEIYNLESLKWTMTSPMSTKRFDLGACVFNGILYVAGGRNSKEVLSSMESYCPQSDNWKSLASMAHRRHSAGFVALNGLLYAVGGNIDTYHSKSCEVYNPQLNTWNSIADMNHVRFSPEVVAMNNFVYACGGYGVANQSLNSTEVYDPQLDTWFILPLKLNLYRGAYRATVIAKPGFID